MEQEQSSTFLDINNNLKPISNIHKDIDTFIHISHTDLDGFGCQYLILKLLQAKFNLLTPNVNNKFNYTFFNMDYSEENEVLNKAFDIFLSDKTKKYYLLITDVGLTEEASKKLNNFLKGNKNINITVQLVDHHKTGLDQSQKYNWFYLNKEKCATNLVFDLFIKPNKELFSEEGYKLLALMSKTINAYDLWLINDTYIGYGKLLSGIVMNFIKYPLILKEHKKEHVFKFLFLFSKMLYANKSVQEIQDKVYEMNRAIIGRTIPKEIAKDDNTSYEDKLYYYFSPLIKPLLKTYKTFDVNGFKFKVVHNWDATFFQHVSHLLMADKTNKIEMLINVKENNKVSLRSEGENYDVGKFSEMYFKGGGHFNAAGSGEAVKELEGFFDQGSLEKAMTKFFNNHPLNKQEKNSMANNININISVVKP